MFNINFLLKTLCLYHTLLSVESRLIKTNTGPVRGKLNHYGKTRYYSYEGIPFAEPPTGDLRFRPPVPIKPWKHVLDATAPGPVCPQTEFFYPRSEMDESCLFLNIYVPDTVSVELLPVVFLIHAGYYTVGSGRPQPTYGPQLILERDIIVVMTNYRLGALGFLSFDDINASGNAGLKDIFLASKWVKSNIKKFGGDPNRICVHGFAVGASLAQYLLLTKQSTGIFQRAILISGSAISYRALQINPKDNALQLARKLGIKYNDSRCLHRLKEIDAFKIVEATDYIISNNPRRAFSFINFFSPSVEKPSSIALITRNPLDIIQTDGLLQKIPIVTGFNNNEGLEIFVALKENPNIVEKLNENFELCIPPNIRYPPKSQARKDLATAIQNIYFGGGNISIFNTQNYINLITDTAYAYGIDSWIQLYKNHKLSSEVYYYVFQFDGQLNWGKQLINLNYPGAGRGDELGYVFVTNVTENKFHNLDCKSRNAMERVLSLVKKFVSTGNPTPQSQQGFEWIEVGSNGNHVVFDDTITTVYAPPLQEDLSFGTESMPSIMNMKERIKNVYKLVLCNP